MRLFQNGQEVKFEIGRQSAGWTEVFIMHKAVDGILRRAQCVDMPAKQIKRPFAFTTSGTRYEFRLSQPDPAPHWETHLYGYAYAVLQQQDNAAAMRAKAIMYGHTEAECIAVAADPQSYITQGTTPRMIFSPLGGLAETKPNLEQQT